MLDIEWTDGDMRKGLTVTHKDPFTCTIDLGWEDVDSAISQLLAYRELMSTKKRLGLSIFKEGGGGNEGDGEEVENYGGTK
tara:strand:- start:881 stop:1123 length:243 start_codon:yes stop_codon:yes gene_type:complete